MQYKYFIIKTEFNNVVIVYKQLPDRHINPIFTDFQEILKYSRAEFAEEIVKHCISTVIEEIIKSNAHELVLGIAD